MPPLSFIQHKILRYIQEYLEEQHYPPTVREIQAFCRFKSPRAVSFHLEKLQQMGFLARSAKGSARTLRPVRLPRPAGSPAPLPAFLSHLPILGRIPAGFPDPISVDRDLDEIEQLDFTPAGEGYDPNRHFALQVSGQSMVGAHILDGDIVIAERRTPVPGEIVVALIDGETTLKRLVAREGQFYLAAENPDYPELHPADELVTQGVVVGVYRSLG